MEKKSSRERFCKNSSRCQWRHFVAITTPIGCHCNPDHDKFHLYLIQLVETFQNVCLWRHSLRSNLEGIDPEKLYLATFICQYAPRCCKVWPSFLFVDDCFVKIWATCDNFLGKWFTAPSGKKLPVRLCSLQCMYNLYAFCRNPKVSRNSSYRFL